MWSDSDDYNRGSCINHCDSMAAEEIGGQADAGNNAVEPLELYEQQGITWLINDGRCYPVKEI